MKEMAPTTFAWIFVLIAVVWIIRQICASAQLFGFKMDRRFITVQITLMVTGVLVWFAGAWIASSLSIDRCLKGGGQWSKETKTCEQ